MLRFFGSLFAESSAPAVVPPTVQQNNSDKLLKLLLIGQSDSGKTELLSQFSRDNDLGDTTSTVGIEFRQKTIAVDGNNVKLQVWDTAGQERFRTITSAYKKGAVGIMVVFDVHNAESFEHAKQLATELKAEAPALYARNIMLVGNHLPQVDANIPRVISNQDAKAFADANGLAYVETSVVNGQGINEAFTALSRTALALQSALAIIAAEENTNKGPGH